MSLTDPVSRDNEPAEELGEVDFQNRKIAAYLMYAAAIFCVVSIFVEGWLTSHWNLNLGFVIFWLCGHFLLTGSRGAVKWSMRLTVLILIIGAIQLITTIVAPYRIEFKDYAITPLIAQLGMYLSLTVIIWSTTMLFFLIKIRRHEKIISSDWVDWKTVVFVIGILILIFSIIGGLMYLESPRTETELSDEIPITNTQAKQVEILKSRYDKQLEYLKTLTVDPNHNIHNSKRRELEQNLLWNDSGIIEASYQALNDDGITLSLNTLDHNSYGYSSVITVPGFHDTGVVTLDDKRYSVLYYRDHFQDDNGVWLGIELVVRQDHLQAKDIRGKVKSPKLE